MNAVAIYLVVTEQRMKFQSCVRLTTALMRYDAGNASQTIAWQMLESPTALRSGRR